MKAKFSGHRLRVAYRLKPALFHLLRKESQRVGKTQTRLVEEALSAYFSVKQ